MIKISLLPSVSVLAFLFLLVLGEKDQIVVEPQSTLFHLNSMCFKEPLLVSQGPLKSPKSSWSASRKGCPRRPHAAGEVCPMPVSCLSAKCVPAAPILISPPVLFTQTCFSDRELMNNFSLQCRRLVGLRNPSRVLAFEPTIRIGAQRRNCSSKKQGLRNQAELK